MGEGQTHNSIDSCRGTDIVRKRRGIRIRICCGILFLVSLIPIMMTAPYVRSTGDDLNYSKGVHHALESGRGVLGLVSAVVSTVGDTWYSWQGTWSSVALFSLQPGIWGNEYYPVTVLVALACILGGTGYFLHVTGKRRGIGTTARFVIFCLTGVLEIQYMPNISCGLFWWTSVAHYCIPYGITLLCMGWSLRYLDERKAGYLVACCLGMGYLGGAGYPEVVLGAVWFFLLLLVEMVNGRSGKRNDGSLRLLLPLMLEMAGFAVSAAAPGNKNRAGEGFGFSMQKVVGTLFACLKEGIVETVRFFITVRPFLPILLIIVLILRLEGRGWMWEKRQIGEKLAAAAAALMILCLVRAPLLYAGTDASGGVPDSYWFITVTMLVWLLEILVTSAGSRSEDGSDQDGSDREACRTAAGKLMRRQCLCGIGVLCAAMLLSFRHLIGNTVDYTCVQFIRSGALADYHSQMEEWLEILEDPEITSAELPVMNDQQGPFMLMVPLDDPNAWSSQVYAAYYGKESVVCVPRNVE